jgi:hypothetical protein
MPPHHLGHGRSSGTSGMRRGDEMIWRSWLRENRSSGNEEAVVGVSDLERADWADAGPRGCPGRHRYAPTISNDYSYVFADYNYFAAEFTIASSYAINSIEGYISNDGFLAKTGTVLAEIYRDGGDSPGERLFSSAFTLGGPGTTNPSLKGWYGAFGLNWVLIPGTYWVALVPDSNIDGCNGAGLRHSVGQRFSTGIPMTLMTQVAGGATTVVAARGGGSMRLCPRPRSLSLNLELWR